MGAIKRILLVIALVLLLAGAVNAAPIVLYTDLVSGPTDGGENNKGCWLSIFGKNFGASAGAITVTIGGVAVDHIVSLGQSVTYAATGIQRIIVQVGALTGLTQNGTAYPIVVTVSGIASNNDCTFIPNPGHILFASLSGNDSTAVINDITHPYRQVQDSRWPGTFTAGALAHAVPGDVIVMRGGTWTDLNSDGYFCRFGLITGTAPTGSAGSGWIAVTSYPGEDVFVDVVGNNIGAFSGSNRTTRPQDGGDYIVISNLRIRAEGNSNAGSNSCDGPVNLQQQSDHWRVVNNDMTNPATYRSRAGGVAGNGAYEKILGNYVHDIYGNMSELECHGMYMDGGTNQANPAPEFAYNYFYNIAGGSGIQFYNVGTNGPNTNGTPVPIKNALIHHNYIDTTGKYGINFADGSGGNNFAYNNVIRNTAKYGLRFNTQDMSGSATASGIFNNTFYNVNTAAPYYGIFNEWSAIGASYLTISNNIYVAANASDPYIGGASVGTVSYNLWYGAGAGPSEDTHKVSADPLFVSTSDLHLQSTSPARNAGTTSSAITSHVTNDFDITTTRPLESLYDIGAYEYGTAAPPASGGKLINGKAINGKHL